MHWSIDVDDEIRLELLDEGHARDLFRLLDDCRPDLERWLPWVPGTTRPEEMRQFVDRARSQWADRDGVQSAVFDRGDVAGSAGLNLAGNAGDLTCWLHPDHRGRGVATRSCKTLMRYGFSRFDIRRCIVRAPAEHPAARATAERLGFTHDATLRDGRSHPDGPMDVAVYSLLRSEWEEEEGKCRGAEG